MVTIGVRDGHYVLTDINLLVDIMSTAFGVDKSKKKNTDITDFTRISLFTDYFL